MTVVVTDASTDPEGDAVTVTVNCGNGTLKQTGAAGTVFTCTYTTPGTYIVKHSVKDPEGLGSASPNFSALIGAAASKVAVSGTLQKQDGTPLSGATLYLQVGTQAKYVAVSAAGTGAFSFNALPGTYTIRAIKPGYTFTNPAEIVPAGSIVVTTGTPVTGLVVKSIQ
jgi:hypothetical protein